MAEIVVTKTKRRKATMSEISGPSFGVSTMSLTPHNLRDIEGLVKELAAFSEISQIMPVRGVTGSEHFPPGLRWYKEKAWNPVDGFFQAAFHRDGDGMLPANLKDYVLFPNPDICREVFARLPGRMIAHDFESVGCDRLVEIGPKINMSLEKIAKVCQKRNIELVLDTEHLVENVATNPFGRSVDEIIDKIPIISPFVKVVHVKGTGGNHRRILRKFLTSSHRSDVDYMAEYRPELILDFQLTIKKASSFVYEMKRIVLAT
ncbi:MAG: hypothetical protein NTW79_04510 [Candidatus Berkelbacteria bacterium]|nr:hypothetical protein [Candidatus Berkelbacteria bacterium]